jgi:hypothetical protein
VRNEKESQLRGLDIQAPARHTEEPATRAPFLIINLMMTMVTKTVFAVSHGNLNSDTRVTPRCTISIEGVFSQCLMDSGAEISLISKALYKKISRKCFTLPTSNISIKTAAGGNMEILGSVICKLELNSKI